MFYSSKKKFKKINKTNPPFKQLSCGCKATSLLGFQLHDTFLTLKVLEYFYNFFSFFLEILQIFILLLTNKQFAKLLYGLFRAERSSGKLQLECTSTKIFLSHQNLNGPIAAVTFARVNA